MKTYTCLTLFAIISMAISCNTPNEPKSPSESNSQLVLTRLEDSLLVILKSNILERQECKPYEVTESSNERLCLTDPSNDSPLGCYDWATIRSDSTATLFTVEDLDQDGQPDYTLELDNQGGGCGGQVSIMERWTLLSTINKFSLTHYIPYRSETNKWMPVL